MNHLVVDISKDSILDQSLEIENEFFETVEGLVFQLGYTDDNGNQVVDTSFETYYERFKDTNKKLGYYWKTQSKDDTETDKEIDQIESLLEEKINDFPVYLYIDSTCTRLSELDKDTITNNLISYTDKLTEKGYRIGIYTDYDYMIENIDYTKFLEKNVSLWISSNEDHEEINYDARRYSSEGDPNNEDDSFNLSIFSKNVANWDERIDINTIDVALSETSYIYNGEEKTPEIECELIADQDYQVEYRNNIDAGSGEAIVTGIGNYKGTRTLFFTIRQRSITTADVSCGAPDDNGCYDLNNLEVRLEGKLLVKDEMYKVTFTNYREVEFIITTIYIEGINNYTGSTRTSYLTKIVNFDITTQNIYIDKTQKYVYNGRDINPTVIAEDMIVDIDYILAYENNINASNEAKVIVKGIQDYHGVVELYFTIEPYSINQGSKAYCSSVDNKGNYDLNTLVVISGKFTLEAEKDYILFKTLEVVDNQLITNLIISGRGNFKDDFRASFKTNDIEENPSDPGASYTFSVGKKVELKDVRIFPRYGSFKTDIKKSGTYYIWDTNIKNNRIRLTNTPKGVQSPGHITGWVNLYDLMTNPDELHIGDKVYVERANLREYADGSGNMIYKEDVEMYIVDLVDTSEFSYYIGLGSGRNYSRIGWAKRSNIKLLEDK